MALGRPEWSYHSYPLAFTLAAAPGLGVAEVVQIATTQLGVAPAMEIVGVVIGAPDGLAEGLSPEVSEVGPRAAVAVRSLLESRATPAGSGCVEGVLPS